MVEAIAAMLGFGSGVFVGVLLTAFCLHRPADEAGVPRLDGKTESGNTPMVSGDSEANKEKG